MSESIIEDGVEIEPAAVVEDVQPTVDEIPEVAETTEIQKIPAPKKRGRPAGSTNKAVRMKPPASDSQRPQRPAEPERQSQHPTQQELDYDLLARTMHAVMENRHVQRHAQRNALYNSFF